MMMYSDLVDFTRQMLQRRHQAKYTVPKYLKPVIKTISKRRPREVKHERIFLKIEYETGI